MRKLLLASAAAAAAAFLTPAPASATLQEVGACVPSALGTPCAPTTFGSTTGAILSLPATSVGAFTISGSSETGTTTTSAFFNSQTLQLSSTTGGLLDIYFTVTGVPTQQVPLVFTSTFTSNQQNADTHSVIESTFLNNSNAAFGTSDTLASATLNNAVLETAGPFFSTRTPGNPVSFTELYQIQLSGCADQSAGSCTGNLTIDLSAAQAAAPEPATLAVLGTGLLGLGFIRARRRR